MELTCYDCKKFDKNVCIDKCSLVDEEDRACWEFEDFISGRAINRRTKGTIEETTCFSKGGHRWDQEEMSV